VVVEQTAAATGAVLQGPADRPLTVIRIQKVPDGQLDAQ
jgi:hypothetical protein